MTSYNNDRTDLLPREISFADIPMPAKRAISIIFEDGTTRATTFYFTYHEYVGTPTIEIYWWEAGEKIIGFYGILEEMMPITVVSSSTSLVEFILLPRAVDLEETVENRIKQIKMSPRFWVYEVDEL